MPASFDSSKYLNEQLFINEQKRTSDEMMLYSETRC